MGVGRPADGQPQGPFGILAQASACNPDFTPSHSFGEVLSQRHRLGDTIAASSIYDVTSGAGAGTYQLRRECSRSRTRAVPLSFTDATATRSRPSRPDGRRRKFFVKTEANGEAIRQAPRRSVVRAATRAGGRS